MRRANLLAAQVVRRLLLEYARRQPRRAAPSSPDKVTILIVNAYGMGGTIRAALNLAGYLGDRREVEILSIHRKREGSFFELPANVTVTPLEDKRPGHELTGVWGLVQRVLSKQRSVLVHPADRYAIPAHNLFNDLQFARAMRGRRGFLIATRPGLNFMAAMQTRPGLITIGLEQMHLGHHVGRLKQMMPVQYPKLDAFVVLTEGHIKQYDKHLKGKAHLVAIPNTVRLLGGPPSDQDARTIFTAGRFRYQKGFELLLEAFAPVAADHPDWKLRICGRGTLKERYEELIERHGLQDAVSLEPPAKHIAEDMAAASIFALSSRFEGFPLILLEAMSKQMAVAAFDCPTGPGDIVDDHRNGLLVPAEDVEGFGRALRELIEDDELRRRCAAAAGDAARDYTMEAIGPRWEALFDDLAARRGRPVAPRAYAEAGGGEAAEIRSPEPAAGVR